MAGAHANVLNIPRPPVFATAAEERLQQTHAGRRIRLVSRFGFDEGVAGHITARDPERLGHFWVTAWNCISRFLN
jgi:hypothetical protein